MLNAIILKQKNYLFMSRVCGEEFSCKTSMVWADVFGTREMTQHRVQQHHGIVVVRSAQACKDEKILSATLVM